MKLGFQFVPFPREVWTDNIQLSQAEFRLLGWFCCGLRFGEQQLEVSDDQILRGFQENGRFYPPAGLSRNSMKKARALLMEKKLLCGKQISEGRGRSVTSLWRYSLNLSESDSFTAENYQTLTPKVSESDSFKPLKVSRSDTAIRNIDFKTREEPEEHLLPEWVPVGPWKDFVDMRKQMKNAPFTPRAQTLAIKDLDRLRRAGDDPAQVLNQSIVCGYRGLFELKKGNTNGSGTGRTGKRTPFEQAQDRINELRAEGGGNFTESGDGLCGGAEAGSRNPSSQGDR